MGAFAGWRQRLSAPDRQEGHGARASGASDRLPEEGVEGPATIAELRSTAATALICTDDSIRSSQQEVAAVRSALGEDDLEPFTAGLDLARDELRQAFTTLRAAREGHETDRERALLEEIVAGCAATCSHLDDLAPRFDALRDLEARIDEVLARLTSALAAEEDRLAVATTTADALRSQFPRATIASVLDDLDQATDRLHFVEASVTTGRALLESADRPGAAARARAAEEAVAQAHTLLDSVDRSPKVLAKAQDAVTTMLQQTERDIAEAERLGVAHHLAGSGQYARETVGWAGEEVSSGGYDPLEMRRALQETDVALGRALGPVRADDDTHERASGLLATSWYGARATVRAADELIMTRRGAIGVESRARLSEARTHYIEGTALGESDPTAALKHLRTADALAYQARTLAQQDEAAWRNLRRMGAGMGALDGMLLGGILIESPANPFSAGAGPRPAGAPGGPGGTGGPEGTPRSPLGPPSFGGAATRGRRVGQGRF
ncbi:MAG TPA: hypothetical protein VES03_04290 [Motilibacterales bacterium]|nr:hypothetical protein [Motilibacterales bacterium]